MEARIFQDTLETAVRLCDVRAEVPVETEILIPDYQPQVFKIVKCFVYPVLLQKQPAAGRLTLEGYLRCVVYYQAEEDQSLCTTEQKLPFSKTVDLPDVPVERVTVTAAGETEYLNCRAVNQRRIDVRGACVLTVRAFGQGAQQTITALSGCGLQQKLCNVETMQPIAASEKLVTAEQEITFETAPAAVLEIGGYATIQEVKLISGKAVVKGEATARILYRTQPGYGVLIAEKKVPFSQILDMEGVDESCQWGGWAELTGCALMSGGEGGDTLSATIMLHLQVWRMAQRSVVCDAFSTQCETALERVTVSTSQPLALLNETTEATCGGQLPDEGAQIVACLATVMPPEAASGEAAAQLRGRAAAHIICLNSLGELECYDRSCEYQLPLPTDAAPEQLDLQAAAVPVGAAARKEGGEATAQITIRVTGLLVRRSQTAVVTGVECGEELPPDEHGVALRVCYAQAGEDVFDIARRYHASPETILKAGGLEQPVLTQPARLLIPAER